MLYLCQAWHPQAHPWPSPTSVDTQVFVPQHHQYSSVGEGRYIVLRFLDASSKSEESSLPLPLSRMHPQVTCFQEGKTWLYSTPLGTLAWP